MKLNSKVYILLTTVLLSCGKYNKMGKTSGNQNDAIENLIVDYSNYERGEENVVYEITFNNESNDLYNFSIHKTDRVFVYTRIKIGDKQSGFPSRFLELKNRLYVWEDSMHVLDKKVFDKLAQYQVLDSTFYKIDMGQLGKEHIPVFTADESKKAWYYFFCKKNVSKFKKILTNKYIYKRDYPKVNCNK